MDEYVEKDVPVTSRDRERGDRHPRQPEGGRPTAEGTPQPDAPGGGGRDPGDRAGGEAPPEAAAPADGQAPGGPEFEAEGPTERDSLAPRGRGTPDAVSEVGAPGQDGRSHRPLSVWSFVYGGVDEANAPLREEVSGYPLTRFELRLLARHWAKESLEVDLFKFYYQMSDGPDYRLQAYARHCLDRIADLLGPDVVKGAVAEVVEEARRVMSDEEWRVFTEGGDGEWDQVHVRVCQESSYLDRKCLDKETQERAFAYLRDHPGQVYLDEAGDLWWLSEPSPGGDGRPAGKLVLRVTTPRGESTFALGYALEKPPEWCPPYRLR
jgi:hypothetical protein